MITTINPLYTIAAILSVALIVTLVVGLIMSHAGRTIVDVICRIVGAYEDEEEYDAEWMDYDKWQNSK